MVVATDANQVFVDAVNSMVNNFRMVVDVLFKAFQDANLDAKAVEVPFDVIMVIATTTNQVDNCSMVVFQVVIINNFLVKD